MKLNFLLLSLIPALASAAQPAKKEYEACQVAWTVPPGKNKDGYYQEIDTVGDGSGLCGGNGQNALDCNYHIDTEDHGPSTPIVHGTCTLLNCHGNNGQKNPGDGSHRLTICHRTCSETNPWVRITIDKSAWDESQSGECKHGPLHSIEDECSKYGPEYTAWGVHRHDYIIKDHGIKKNWREWAEWKGESNFMLADDAHATAMEKEYWKYWEPACPYVRHGDCCYESDTEHFKADCCGADTLATKMAGGGGDPHIKRWNRKSFEFHGECDLVLAHADMIYNGKPLDLHIRTVIHEWWSQIDSAALRVGDVTLQVDADKMFINGQELLEADLPFATEEFTISAHEGDAITGKVHGAERGVLKTYAVTLNDFSVITFKILGSFINVAVEGSVADFAHAVGLMGDYNLGKPYNRKGERLYDLEEFAFEWQVDPSVDPILFMEPKGPQLPHERCRMPSVSKTSRKLRTDAKLVAAAEEVCASLEEREACMKDVLATGDVNMALVHM